MKIKSLLIILALIITSALLLGYGCAKVAKEGDTVLVHYTGTLEDGTVFDTSRDGEPFKFTIGSHETISGFNNAVRGMKVGEIKTVTIPPEQAYGPYSEEYIMTYSRDILEEGFEPEIGQQLQLMMADGEEYLVTVVEISDTEITVDVNHPLAGQELTLEIELVDIVTAE